MQHSSRLAPAILIALCALSTAVPALAEEAVKKVDVPAGQLIVALKTLAQQSGVEFFYSTDQLEGLQSNGVHGEYTAEKALLKLLEGTSLKLTRHESGALVISVSEPRESAGSDTPHEAPNDIVVVTGTHIANGEPVTPTQVYTRDDFDKAGAVTAEDFMATLPQNFGGTQSAASSGDGLEGVFDPGMGSGVSLRGLGSASTLVLVDGQRVAAAGRSDYSDISMIPLSAVERIEVMTDGASALYGSDAVGGVVNFIMRKDFSGAETRLRYGDTTRGGLAQRQASQLFGERWSTGGAVVSYEYFDQAALDRYDRDFSAHATGSRVGPKSLLPAEERHTASLFVKQDITDRVQLSVNGTYAQREGERWDFSSGVVQPLDVKREQFGGGVGLRVKLAGSWRAQLNGTYDKGTQWRRIISNPVTGATTVNNLTSDLQSVDLLVSGDLVSLPWGAVGLAAGAAYREEGYTSKGFRSGVLSGAPTDLDMDVSATYAELSIPIGAQGDLPRAPLMISLAVRREDYSTFGTTTDPRYGLRWTPLKSLSLHASYGTSFKAPTLFQFQETPGVNSNAVISNAAINIPPPPGRTHILMLTGNSTDLTEQTADTFSAGAEFSIPAAGVHAQLNYFNIDYSDRIQTVGGLLPQVLMTNPAYRSLVTFRGDIPDAEFDARIAEYLSSTNAQVISCTAPLTSSGSCPMSPSVFSAIVNRKLQNFATVKVSGLDLSVAQDLTLGTSAVNWDVNASYFLKYEQQLDPGTAADDILNRVYNPVDLRLRGRLSWARKGWSATLSTAYTAGYSTKGARLRTSAALMPVTDISSWTTVDLALGYKVREGANRWLEGLTFSLNATNLFDEDPPFVDDQYYGLGFDPANADPRGRLLSLTIGKTW